MSDENQGTQDDNENVIEDLKATHLKETQKLHSESARYRTERNTSLRRLHALEQVVKAHGIDVSSISDDSLKSLEIEDGKVVGMFEYTAPKLQAKKTTSERGKQQDLSLNSLSEMSEEDINRNWDKVQQVLRSAA